MARVQYCRGFVWCAVAALFSGACGGSVVISPGSSGAGPAGGGAAAGGASHGSGGAGASGAATAGAPGTSCVYQGKSYADGQTFSADDGCNSCSCHAGVVGCTLLDCQNTCSALQSQYAEALKRAKACKPGATTDQCSSTVQEHLSCGCATPVNGSNKQALSDLAKLSMAAVSSCFIPCDSIACVATGPATCSKEGSCEFATLRGGKTACKVGGVIYPSGSSGITEPGGCNQCNCEDGQLSCTEIACPPGTACPKGTQRGTQCAQCGPTDACEVVEHACLPVCSGSCSNGGLCSDGVCRLFCG